MYDVLTTLSEKTIKCLDKGHVTLIDSMPRLVSENQTADSAIVQAARVSYGDGTKTVSEDRGLIRYLIRHKHTTPLEMVVFKFHCKMPIFVARQWIRHRASSTNEVSGRYSVLKDEFYYPEIDQIRQQSKTNKQGGDQQMELGPALEFLSYLDEACVDAYENYEKLLDNGVSREQARMVLPLNLYTEWYWKSDLHNLFHFLSLRCDSHAQYEIRVFAEAILKLIQPIVPFAVEAWNDYHDHRGAIRVTRLELAAIQKMLNKTEVIDIDTENKREQEEWYAKALKLGAVEQAPF